MERLWQRILESVRFTTRLIVMLLAMSAMGFVAAAVFLILLKHFIRAWPWLTDF